MPYGPYTFRRPPHRIQAQPFLPSTTATVEAIIPLETAVCVLNATLDLTAPDATVPNVVMAQPRAGGWR
jgi:hypothetical protein